MIYYIKKTCHITIIQILSKSKAMRGERVLFVCLKGVLCPKNALTLNFQNLNIDKSVKALTFIKGS